MRASEVGRSIALQIKSLQHPRHMYKYMAGGVEFLIGYAEGWRERTMSEEGSHGIFLWCLTDKRLVFRSYCPAAWGGMHPKMHEAHVKGEMRRISSLRVDELEELLNSRNGYNPFLDRRHRAKVALRDLRLRSKFRAGDFADSPDMNAASKRALVHSFERFLTALLYGGTGYAVSRYNQKIGEGLFLVFPGLDGEFDRETMARMSKPQLQDLLRRVTAMAPSKRHRDVGEVIISICNSYSNERK